MTNRPGLVGVLLVAGGVALLAPPAGAGKRMVGVVGQRVPAKTEIRLLSSGAAPRRVIRYHFRAGTAVTWRMKMKTTMAMSLGSRQLIRTALPTSQTFMATRVRSVDARRRASVEVRVTRVAVQPSGGVAPAQMALFKRTLQGLVGFRGTSLVTPRGVVERARFHYPAGMTAQSRQIVQGLEQQMRQLTTQLPAQPVGVGARWRVRIPIKGPPMRFVSVLTYRLLRRTRDSVQVALSLTGFAPPQRIAYPGKAIAGMRLWLRNMTAHGKGRMTFSLDRPAVSGSLTAAQEMDSELRMAVLRRPMKLKTRIEVQFR